MTDEPFSALLTGYMRRIRASAAGVATEIGLSREAVNNWRNGLSLPSERSRDKLLACARYLRLTEAETNRLLGAARFAPEYPLHQEQVGAQAASQAFAGFIEGLFAQLAQAMPYPISLLLSQAHWGQPPFREALLQRARSQYGDAAVLHIQPPFSVSADSSEYFAAIARQCGFSDMCSDYEFEAALEKKLMSGSRLFCLVSRFEQGTPALREALAGILRSLSEMHSGRLHLLLCGGEALADLKYRSGDLSLLNIAHVNHWPELTLEDMAILARQRWPEHAVSPQVLTQLQALCGGHPALFEEGMQWMVAQGLANGAGLLGGLEDSHWTALRVHLVNSARLWQTFLPVAQAQVKSAQTWLLDQLCNADLGRARPYLQDDNLRRLFWGNLIHVRGHGEQARLYWRSDTVRDAGRMVLDSCLNT